MQCERRRATLGSVSLRQPLRDALAVLLAASADSRAVTLDELGDALGTLAVSTDEIDAMITALEAAGRSVDSARGGHGEASLHVVLRTARELKGELGRNPSSQEISTRAGLPMDRVLHALRLAKVMAR